MVNTLKSPTHFRNITGACIAVLGQLWHDSKEWIFFLMKMSCIEDKYTKTFCNAESPSAMPKLLFDWAEVPVSVLFGEISQSITQAIVCRVLQMYRRIWHLHWSALSRRQSQNHQLASATMHYKLVVWGANSTQTNYNHHQMKEQRNRSLKTKTFFQSDKKLVWQT